MAQQERERESPVEISLVQSTGGGGRGDAQLPIILKKNALGESHVCVCMCLYRFTFTGKRDDFIITPSAKQKKSRRHKAHLPTYIPTYICTCIRVSLTTMQITLPSNCGHTAPGKTSGYKTTKNNTEQHKSNTTNIFLTSAA